MFWNQNSHGHNCKLEKSSTNGSELLKEQIYIECKLKGQSRKFMNFGTFTMLRGGTTPPSSGNVQVAHLLAAALTPPPFPEY